MIIRIPRSVLYSNTAIEATLRC